MRIKVNKSSKPYVVKPNKQKDFLIEFLDIPNEEYQRASKQWHVDRLSANWRDEVYTRPLIAVRPDGKNIVVNGAHTLFALAAKGAVVAPCEYFISKSNEKEAIIYEAGIFGAKNTNLQMSQCSKFKAEVAKREPNALRINKAIRSCGLYVEEMKANGIKITSIKSCKDAYCRVGMGRVGMDHLKTVLALLKKKWEGQQKCFHGGTIGGMSLFLSVYGSIVNMKTLEKSMGNYSPARLFFNEDGSIGPSTREVVVAKNLRKFYNSVCAKKDKLPIVSLGKKKKKAKV